MYVIIQLVYTDVSDNILRLKCTAYYRSNFPKEIGKWGFLIPELP